MMQHDFGAKWRRLAAAEGLDARRDYWRWDEDRRVLRTRPGASAKLAELVLAGLDGGDVRHEVLETVGHGLVAVSRTALRRDPAHGAEQISQLRLGQPFEVWADAASGEWLLGCGADGYPGWLRSWHLLQTAAPFAPGERAVVTARSSAALAAPRAGAAVIEDLSCGTRLPLAGAPRGGFTPWRTPAGAVAWSPSADLSPFPVSGDARDVVCATALRLLGAPYEWGGCSTWGFDCSGLTQTLFSIVGVDLPRDADLQVRAGEPLACDDPTGWRAGDLAFFGEEKPDHVGLLLEGGRLLHARGIVRVDDLAALRETRKLSLHAVRNCMPD